MVSRLTSKTIWATGWVACVLAVSCSSKDRAPSIGSLPNAELDAGGSDGLFIPDTHDGPPALDASGFCGNQLFSVVQDPPNLYFVLDRSGSMSADSGYKGYSRYKAVWIAVVEIVRTLGKRANFGAAVFPGTEMPVACELGEEVFPTQPGDPPEAGPNGPVTLAFARSTDFVPGGGTPVSSTLASIAPKLYALPGKTAVVLATDGAPNCNYSLDCGPEDCVYNIEGAVIGNTECTPTFNCCSSSIWGGPGALGCVDSITSIAAVQKLKEQGIKTYLVGVPGSLYYEALLDQMAITGGTARATSPRYYQVQDMAQLSSILNEIGTQALVTCSFTIDTPPEDRGFVNVYLDGQTVLYDAVDGWSWTGDQTLQLNGEACDKLERGVATDVQVVAGCPTEIPK